MKIPTGRYLKLIKNKRAFLANFFYYNRKTDQVQIKLIAHASGTGARYNINCVGAYRKNHIDSFKTRLQIAP
jgi:hypothetical protein